MWEWCRLYPFSLKVSMPDVSGCKLFLCPIWKGYNFFFFSWLLCIRGSNCGSCFYLAGKLGPNQSNMEIWFQNRISDVASAFYARWLSSPFIQAWERQSEIHWLVQHPEVHCLAQGHYDMGADGDWTVNSVICGRPSPPPKSLSKLCLH